MTCDEHQAQEVVADVIVQGDVHVRAFIQSAGLES